MLRLGNKLEVSLLVVIFFLIGTAIGAMIHLTRMSSDVDEICTRACVTKFGKTIGNYSIFGLAKNNICTCYGERHD